MRGYSHGTRWTHELIAQKILEAVDALGLKVMPTRKQLVQYYGDDRLTNKVNKTLGYYGWAKELNLPIQVNDTSKAKLSERHAAGLLRAHGYTADQMLQNYPFDILVNSKVRIDVKFANLYHGPAGNFYSFALRKKYPTCDIYMLIASSCPERIYIVPACRCMQTQIGIGENTSIYEKYHDRYDIIDQYLKFYQRIA